MVIRRVSRGSAVGQYSFAAKEIEEAHLDRSQVTQSASHISNAGRRVVLGAEVRSAQAVVRRAELRIAAIKERPTTAGGLSGGRSRTVAARISRQARGSEANSNLR